MRRDEDEHYMEQALALADQAAALGEVPVGALVVAASGEILGSGFNRRELDKDPTAHAEILALRAAARRIGGWRLIDTRLYVTLEPCPMCSGALVNARVGELVFGCHDPKSGAIETLYNLGQDPRLNHRLVVTSGVLAEACAERLSSFFARLRSPKIEQPS